jgi:outer membrane murein-binding lipoprotein Lpp
MTTAVVIAAVALVAAVLSSWWAILCTNAVTELEARVQLLERRRDAARKLVEAWPAELEKLRPEERR